MSEQAKTTTAESVPTAAVVRDTGGPAFSRPLGGIGRTVAQAQEGMSLRAYLAGQAVIGIISTPGPKGLPIFESPDEAARAALNIADACREAAKGADAK